VSIAVAYALGAIRILRFGALVQQANSIESLSHVDVLCLDKTGTLTANRLEVEAVSGLGGATEDEVIAVLSALAASATVRNQTTQAIARWPREDALPQAAEVPFLVGPQVERRGVRARGHRAARDHRARAPTFLRLVAGRLASTASRRPGRELERASAAWTERGLRVLLVATFDDAAALPAHEERPTPLPAGCGARARGHGR
jgi:cation-transporting ATPase E